MSTVTEIQQAIIRLPDREQKALARWFAEVRADAWDAQIERDANSGKLDQLYHQLTKENGEQEAVPLDGFLDDGKLS